MKLNINFKLASITVSIALVLLVCVLELSRSNKKASVDKCQSLMERAIIARSKTEANLSTFYDIKNELLQMELGNLVVSSNSGSSSETQYISTKVPKLLDDANASIEKYSKVRNELMTEIDGVRKVCDKMRDKVSTLDITISISYILLSVAFFVSGLVLSNPVFNILNFSTKNDN